MAQSATVTGRGGSAGGHSMRTWTSGRFGAPPMRRSASSSPHSSTRTRNDSTRLSESIKKSAGPTSPASPSENLVPARPVSSRHAEVGDHPPVAPTRGPMREELRAIVRAAPRRARDLRQAEPLRLAGEQVAQVDVPRGGLGGEVRAELRQDFRTYFIALATNANPAMHYNTRCRRARLLLEELHAALQDATGRAPPPGVQQRHDPLLGDHEIDRNAIGDRDGEQHAATAGGVAVHAVQDEPAVVRL